jgi:hypothetical protein
MPYVNTEAMQVFLDRFAATIGDDEHVAMMLDQAGWHGSGALRIPYNVTLVPLPPYSPELNPVERVWLHLSRSASSPIDCSPTTMQLPTPPATHGTAYAPRSGASLPYAPIPGFHRSEVRWRGMSECRELRGCPPSCWKRDFGARRA